MKSGNSIQGNYESEDVMIFGARIYEIGPMDMQKLPIITLAAVSDETIMLTLDLSKVLSVREIKTKKPCDYVELEVLLALPRGDGSTTLLLTHEAYNGEILRHLKYMADSRSKKAS
jgi:hypothetical protein